MKFTAQAPSNIALIKYMGKTEVENNRPLNASLSYTLNNLTSFVEIDFHKEDADLNIRWEPLNADLNLSVAGQERFMRHFENLCRGIGLSGDFTIRSTNDFPSACGLASSASSFAALTKCFGDVARKFKGLELSAEQLSQLSQRGSGSSCRSLFPTWALWETEGAKQIEVPYQNLLYDVVVINTQEKLVLSSEAHLRVSTSLNFVGRAERAQKRLALLLSAFEKRNWTKAFEICWAEFWDMHSLFETSQPAFGYMTPETLTVLNLTRDFWHREGDGPLVTMDAGPNIHFLWRQDQSILRVRLKQMIVSKGYNILDPDSKV